MSDVRPEAMPLSPEQLAVLEGDTRGWTPGLLATIDGLLAYIDALVDALRDTMPLCRYVNEREAKAHKARIDALLPASIEAPR